MCHTDCTVHIDTCANIFLNDCVRMLFPGVRLTKRLVKPEWNALSSMKQTDLIQALKDNRTKSPFPGGPKNHASRCPRTGAAMLILP